MDLPVATAARQHDRPMLYTGGKPFDPALPASCSSTARARPQRLGAAGRYLAHHGTACWRSTCPGTAERGPPLDSVEAAGRWMLALLDAAACSAPRWSATAWAR